MPIPRCRSSPPLHAPGGPTRLAGRGGEAEAVPAHRPGRMHPLRRLCRHLPVEVHPHAVRRRHRGFDGSEKPGDDPHDHVFFVVDEDVCTRCALCVDRCPTGVIILGKTGADQRVIRTSGITGTDTPTEYASEAFRTREDLGTRAVATGRRRRPLRASCSRVNEKMKGSQAWKLDLPSRLLLPEGLHGQPPEPVLRDHEQRGVPPSPGEGEAARREGLLHPLPGWVVLLPVHPADGHRHLPDVLLPAHGGGAWNDIRTLETAVTFGSLVRNMHRWGAAPHGALRLPAHEPGSSTTVPISRPGSSTGWSA